MEGYIRPGCVYLTLQMLVEQSVYVDAVARGLPGLLSHLLHATGCAFWWAGSYTVQLMGDMAAVDAGQVRQGCTMRHTGHRMDRMPYGSYVV
jgi:hypothetical protein